MAKSDHHPNSDRLSKRALQTLLTTKTAKRLTAAAFRARVRKVDRFSGPHAWGRLVLLGVLLIDLSLLGMGAPSLMLELAGYWPGLAATFGGLLIAIIMIKLSRPGIYWDWTALGALQIGLGMVLKASPYLIRPLEATFFYGLLIIAASLLLWIAATTKERTGRAWLGAGGLASLTISAFGSIDYLAIGLLRPEVVALTTAVLIGMSVFGLGLSLKPKTKR